MQNHPRPIPLTALSSGREGRSSLYKHIAEFPELGRFRRLAPYFAKRLHDDTFRFQAAMASLNRELAKYPELGGKTVLDCPLRLVQARCPEGVDEFKPLWDAWAEYDKWLVEYGQTLCLSEQIMKLPDQDTFHTRQLAKFVPPVCDPIFERGLFVPTGEEANKYQEGSGPTDSCAWRAIPRQDFLTMRFVDSSSWLEKRVLARLRHIVKGTKPSDSEESTDMRFDRIVGVMDTISCLIASILLALTVFVLVVVRPGKIRVLVVGIAGTVFALLLKLMAGNISRGEVFGTTATFYAVAAVFLGSTDISCACH